MHTPCEKCHGKGSVRLIPQAGGKPYYDRCRACIGTGRMLSDKPDTRPKLTQCLVDAAKKRRDEPARFVGLQNGDLMRIAERTTPGDVIPLVALIAAVVAVLAVPL